MLRDIAGAITHACPAQERHFLGMGVTYDAAFTRRMNALFAPASHLLNVSHKTPATFVHIPKAAGSNFIALAHSCFTDFDPAPRTGIETCYPYARAVRPKSIFMIMFRSPRDHVHSQYHQCVQISGSNCKLGNNHECWPANWTAAHGFEDWISYFHGDSLVTFTGRCYNPHNLQARALTCHQRSNHNAVEHNWEPPLERALANLRSIEFVGIVEFFDESICLLLLGLRTLPPPPQCRCPTGTDAHSSASPRTHRSKTPPLATEDHVLHAIDRLTSIDFVVYQHALRLFFNRVHEEEARLGYAFMCRSRLDRAQASLDYISTNLSRLYFQSL
mmetsp:Transcript_9285/g.18947  ORF Transcript_9285/g.18947 Transcript_9285/m.18947 type:complete len:331 (-) Transcript_9285:180-1172(-)